MNVADLLRLDALRVARGARNRLRSENPLARLNVSLSIAWVLLVAVLVLWWTVRSGRWSGPGDGFSRLGATALLVAALLADAVRRGRSRSGVVFESWLMSSGVHETTLRARAAIVVVARSLALAWLPLVLIPGSLSCGAASVARTFGATFVVLCAGEAVGRAWHAWPRVFRLAWSASIVGVWGAGVALLFGVVTESALPHAGAWPLGVVALCALAAWSVLRPPARVEPARAALARVRRSAGVSERGHLLEIFLREVRVFAAFVRHDSLLVVIVTGFAGLPQVRLTGAGLTATAADGLRSPAGVFATLMQVAMVAVVVGEVLWERDRPATWAFCRSAGALRRVALVRSAATVAAATLWYALVTAPTSILIGTPSLVKHALAVTVLGGLAGTAALGSALGAALGASPAQSRAFRMAGVIGVSALFFHLAAASAVARVVVALGLLSLCLTAALGLLSRSDLGLQRL